MNDIRLLQLNSYVRPALSENKAKDWVLNGKNNSFYDYIIDRYNGSPTNSAVINSFINITYGRGLSFRNKQDTLNWVKLASILNPKELRKIIADYIIFGECAMQVIQTKGGKLSEIAHAPINKLAPSIENDKGEIDTYWFSDDWARQSQNVPEPIPAFNGGKQPKSIYAVKPYSVGKSYFSDPTYLSILPYCEVEEELANFYINSIKKGLSAGYIINVPDGNSLSEEEKAEFERQIKLKLTGSPNALSFVLSFNGRDAEITVTPFPVNENQHKQWSFLTEEATQKILTGHLVTSPAIVGIISSSGFSNTADEMDMAEKQLIKRVISPKKNEILYGLTEILSQFDINLDLFFLPLTEEKEIQAPTTELSSHVCLSEDEATEDMANELIQFGENLETDNWVLLSTADVDYDTDDDLYDLVQLASTGTARPNAKSSQDNKDIAIRYRYVGNPAPERLFCKLMVSANKLYRKEDIIQMGSKAVNDGFGMGGSSTYSIWLWKGGGKLSAKYPNGTCKHKWQREIYLKRGGGVDANSPLAKTISTSEARRRGYKVPVNDSDVSITPNKNKS